MARIARVVIPEIPHHVVQRGNRSQKVFFKESDKREYLILLGKESKKAGLDIWSYCLMDNRTFDSGAAGRRKFIKRDGGGS